MLFSMMLTSNGVKQGGCISPTLFSIYLNDLIDVLRSSNIGCRYGNYYMGVYCYADDIGLLSPTLSGLKEMLKILLFFLPTAFICICFNLSILCCTS